MLLLTDDLASSARLKPIFDTVQSCTLQLPDDALKRPPVYSFIACHVDLRDETGLDNVSAALQRHRLQAAIPLLFVLKADDEASISAAEALGATSSISDRATDDELVASARRCIRGLVAARYAARQSNAPLRHSIEAVGKSITSLFDDARNRRAISARELSAGADALLASVKQSKLKDWVELVRRYDDATYQHCLLVAGLVASFAARLGLTFERQHLLSQAALVHDLGKAFVPKAILNKAGPLTAAEQMLIRNHPAEGHAVISKGSKDPLVLDVVLHHHELLDGSGYPKRLSRGQISEPVRLTTICDIYAALIERRPYKAAMSHADGRAVLHGMSGKLDPALLAAFDGVIAAL